MSSHFSFENPLNWLGLIIVFVIHWEEAYTAHWVWYCQISSTVGELNILAFDILFLLGYNQGCYNELILGWWLYINIALTSSQHQILAIWRELNASSGFIKNIVFLEISKDTKNTKLIVILIYNTISTN